MLNMIQKNSRLTNYAKTYFEGVINQFVLACRQGSKPARKPPPPLPSLSQPSNLCGRQANQLQSGNNQNTNQARTSLHREIYEYNNYTSAYRLVSGLFCMDIKYCRCSSQIDIMSRYDIR